MESAKKRTMILDGQVPHNKSVDDTGLHIADVEADASITEKLLPEAVPGREALNPQPSNDPNDPLVRLSYIQSSTEHADE